MSWIQLTLSLGTQEAQGFEDALVAAGAVAITYESLADEVVLEPAPGAIPMWQSISLLALFPVDAGMAGLNDALRGLDSNIHERLQVDFIAEEDWHRRLANHTVRAEFGDKLWLLPKSELGNEIPQSRNSTSGGGQARALYLDPGLAFGSGSHPTTRMCLEYISRSAREGHQVLDFGCGSGILAIAAALFGASVVAVDHDPQALIATRENAEFNGVSEYIETLSLAQWQDRQSAFLGQFDIVVANILADPITDLGPTFCSVICPGGDMVLSGILDRQAQQVMDAYPQVAFDPMTLEDEWVCLTGRLTE